MHHSTFKANESAKEAITTFARTRKDCIDNGHEQIYTDVQIQPCQYHGENYILGMLKVAAFVTTRLLLVPKIETKKERIHHQAATMIYPASTVGKEHIDVERLEEGDTAIVQVFVDGFSAHRAKSRISAKSS